MAKPNYNFEKRQRELKKNKKQEEKRLKKLAARESADGGAETSDAPTDSQDTST